MSADVVNRPEKDRKKIGVYWWLAERDTNLPATPPDGQAALHEREFPQLTDVPDRCGQ